MRVFGLRAAGIWVSWTATTGWIAIFAGYCTGGDGLRGGYFHLFVLRGRGARDAVQGFRGGDTVVYDRREALKLLYEDSLIRSYFWDKLFKRELFDGVLFPEDHTVFEDMAIM